MTGVEGLAGGATLRAVSDASEHQARKADEGDQARPIEADERLAPRVARADRYFEKHLGRQRDWYDGKAASYKKWSQKLGFTIILCGALVTLAQVFHPQLDGIGWSWAIPAFTAVLGVIISLAQGLEWIGKFQDSWMAYRRAFEQMKREYRLYINGAGLYADTDEDRAYRRFVENTEAIIAEEQQIYWQSRADAGRKDTAGDEPKRPGE